MIQLITWLPLFFGFRVIMSAQDQMAISGFVAACMALLTADVNTAHSSGQLEIDMEMTLDHVCSEGARDATVKIVSG